VPRIGDIGKRGATIEVRRQVNEEEEGSEVVMGAQKVEKGEGCV
jgi:hypothetical protein